ncbi:hypothetical protein X798_03972 [Onchocerca flexuosa]|uniref:Lipoprotein n=2 Tax=Onchocerca flexuosa TaxID=387005 RepID=A0A183GZC2_9BILA|nr:hypothetical protein X798_03972 [Onchocerca flexuosa]VDO26297.1 unnamed protein product [Onchocerca flexuosa]
MESILLLPIIIKTASICLQTCIYIGITVLLIITCCKKDSIDEENADEALKPQISSEITKSPAQQAAIEKIREGQMTPAGQNQTIDDAISNWGAVQKVEGSV